MKKLTLLISLVIIVLVQSCTIKKVKDVTKISFETKGVITVMEGNKDKFVGPKNVNVDVTDGKLTLSGGTSETIATLFLTDVTTSNITCIELKDGGIYSDTLHLLNNNLNICVSGNSNFAGFVVAKNATINLSGNGEMVLKGTGEDLTMHMSNYSKYTSPTFEWQNANVTITDTAKCTIKVANKLTVDASEDANLGYIGVIDSSFTVSDDAKVFKFPVNL